MNESKKLLYVKLVVALVGLLFILLLTFLIVKIDIVGHLFNNQKYIRTSTYSNLDRYLDDLNNREYKVEE